MSVSVVKVGMASKREWDRVWSQCPYATYFHSREWAELWQGYDGSYHPSPYQLVFSDGSRAILPLTWHQAGQKFFSAPAWTYGGLISLGALDERHLQAAVEYVPAFLGSLFLRMNPFAGEWGGGDGILQLHDDETHVLPLAGGMESIFKSWTKGHKSAASKARREGVTACAASSLDDWRQYYSMYESSLERWGDKVSSRYGWPLFEEMHRRESDNIKLWLAWHQDRAVAGAVCLYGMKHVTYWHGAALKEYFTLRPVQLLLHEAIRDAADRGFSWFDFNPSGGHRGVASFKRGFGAISLRCPWTELQEKAPPGMRRRIGNLQHRISRYAYDRFK